jgi:flap endonuclease-1
LTKIDTNLDTCVRLVYSDILENLDMTECEFLDLCIMCGCDYNKNIPKIGVETSFKYIKQYKSIDEFSTQTNTDVKILNHIRTRELFLDYEKINLNSVPFCGTPDFEKLEEFISKYKLSINIETLKKNFTHVIIVMEDS